MNTIDKLNNQKRGISWHDWLERNRLQDLRGVALRAKLTKFAAIAALLLAVVFWGRAADYQAVLGFLVCAGAIRVAFLAAALGRHDWGSVFAAIALIFNPGFPLLALTGRLEFLVVSASTTAFAASLFLLEPRLTPAVARN